VWFIWHAMMLVGGMSLLAITVKRQNDLLWIVCLFVCLFVSLFAPSALLRCWLGGRRGIQPVKNLSGGMLAWLSVWGEMQIAYGPADATATHCLLLL